jgi:hypothetical protein
VKSDVKSDESAFASVRIETVAENDFDKNGKLDVDSLLNTKLEQDKKLAIMEEEKHPA